MSAARPMTPDQVAEIWGCSPNHVRNLIHRGELRAFRLGRRLIRIPPDALEDYEKCQTNIASEGSTADSSLPGGRTESGDGIVVLHSPERKRKQRQSA